MPNVLGDHKLDHSCPQGLLALLCKANLECKEIRASDWLKPISTLLTLVFYVLHSRFGFPLQEAYL